MGMYSVRILLILIMAFLPSQVLGDGTRISAPPSDNSEAYTCSPKKQKRNQEIRKWCDSKWTHWGVIPKPDESQLRQVNECFHEDNTWSSQMMEHCPEGLLSVPLMIFNLILIGIVSSQGPEKGSPSYILTHGNLNELKGHFMEEVIRSKCNGIASDRDIRLLHEKLCPHRQTVLNGCPPEKQAEWQKTVDEATVCRRGIRSYFRENPSILRDIDKNAQAIIAERERIKAMVESNNKKINQIKATCDPIINPQRYNILRYSPYFLQIDALKQAKDFVFPNRKTMIRYNKCVQNQAANDPELLNQLLRRTGNLIEKLYADAFGSLKCFNSEKRIEYFCEMVGRIGTGGALSLASVLAAKRASRNFTDAVEDGLRRDLVSARRNADEVPLRRGKLSTKELIERHKAYIRRYANATTAEEKKAIIADELRRLIVEGNEEYIKDGNFKFPLNPVTRGGGKRNAGLFRGNIDGRDVFVKELKDLDHREIQEIYAVSNGKILESLGYGPGIDIVEKGGKRYLVMDEVPGINIFEILIHDQRTPDTKKLIDSLLSKPSASIDEARRNLADFIRDDPVYFRRMREMAEKLKETGFKSTGDLQFMIDPRRGPDSIQIIDTEFFRMVDPNAPIWKTPIEKMEVLIEEIIQVSDGL